MFSIKKRQNIPLYFNVDDILKNGWHNFVTEDTYTGCFANRPTKRGNSRHEDMHF